MKTQSLKVNFIFSLIYQLCNLLIPVITLPYLARVLGPTGLGIQSYTMSIQQFFLLFSSLGAFIYGSRMISMERKDSFSISKTFWEIEIIVVCSTLIALFFWSGICLFSSKYSYYYTILAIGVFANLFDISWFFNGLELFKLTVIRSLFFKILGAIAVFTFVKTSSDLPIYIFILSISTLLSNLSLWLYLKNYIVKVSIKELQLKKHIKETIIYFIPTVSTSIYTVLDRVLIGFITQDPAQNGYYQQAEKILGIVQTIVFTAINSVFGVRNAFLFAEKNFEEIKKKIEFSLNFIVFLSCGCCFGIIAVADNLVPLYLGSEFSETTTLLYLLAPIIFIIGISNCLGSQYYTPCGLRKQSSYYLIAGAIVNLLLNFVFIPVFKARGAAVASLIAESVITFLYVKNCNGFTGFIEILKILLKKVISGILMLCVVYSIKFFEVSGVLLVACQIICGVIVYLVLLAILKDTWYLSVINRIFSRIYHNGKIRT